MTTGEKIRQRRLELGMTMEDLGKAIGVQRSAINKYEKGLVDIKSSTLSLIAHALDIPVSALLDDLEEPPDQPQTKEAKLLARGVDKMPKEQREQLLNVFKAIYPQYAGYFEERERNQNHDDD